MACVFCRIIKNEIPSSKVYEDDNTIAFLDINPANKGHVLVVTREHYEHYEDLPESELINLSLVLQKLSKTVIKAVDTDAYNLILNNGKESGQVIPHIHFHIIPRFRNDGLHLGTFREGKYKDKEMQEIAEKIKENL